MEISAPAPFVPLFRETILPELQKNGFIDPAWYGGKHMGVVRTAAVKSYTDETAVYVHFIDSREAGEHLQCRVWIAPWHQPDDSLERLQIGYQFVAYDEWDFDASIARAISVRVKAIDDLSESLRYRTLADLENPPIQTKRWSIYRAERDVVGVVRSALPDAWSRLTGKIAVIPAREFTFSAVQDSVGAFETENHEKIHEAVRDLNIACGPSSYAPALINEAFHFTLARRCGTQSTGV